MKSKAVETRLKKLFELSLELQDIQAPEQVCVQPSPVHGTNQIWITFKTSTKDFWDTPVFINNGDKKLQIEKLDKYIARAQKALREAKINENSNIYL